MQTNEEKLAELKSLLKQAEKRLSEEQANLPKGANVFSSESAKEAWKLVQKYRFAIHYREAEIARFKKMPWHEQAPTTQTCDRCGLVEEMPTRLVGDETYILCEDCYSDQVAK